MKTLVEVDKLSEDTLIELESCNHIVTFIDREQFKEVEVTGWEEATVVAMDKGFRGGLAEIDSYLGNELFATTTFEKVGVSQGKVHWKTAVAFDQNN